MVVVNQHRHSIWLFVIWIGDCCCCCFYIVHASAFRWGACAFYEIEILLIALNSRSLISLERIKTTWTDARTNLVVAIHTHTSNTTSTYAHTRSHAAVAAVLTSKKKKFNLKAKNVRRYDLCTSYTVLIALTCMGIKTKTNHLALTWKCA